MALPVIAAAAARAAATRARGAQRAGEKPKATSPEGIMMLALAATLWCINIIIGILDFVFGIGVILGPVVNIPATILIGAWLWLRSGSPPIKKALGPLVLNSIPFAKFFPWWLFSVATSLDWKGGSAQEQPQEDQRLGGVAPKAAQAPA